jgi:hypothetical protein
LLISLLETAALFVIARPLWFLLQSAVGAIAGDIPGVLMRTVWLLGAHTAMVVIVLEVVGLISTVFAFGKVHLYSTPLPSRSNLGLMGWIRTQVLGLGHLAGHPMYHWSRWLDRGFHLRWLTAMEADELEELRLN